MNMSRPILFLACSLLIVSAGIILLLPSTTQQIPARSITPTPPSTPIPKTPSRMTLQGEYSCIPHKDTRSPQILHCALELKLPNISYVSLDVASISETQTTDFPTGTTLQVTGLYYPIEMLSSDHWQKYNLKGIIKVESIKRL